MKKVISIVMNNFKNDTRVLKEAITLKNNSFDVMVLALHDGKSNLKEYDSVSDIDVRRIILKTKNLPKSLFYQIIKYVEFFCKAVRECRKADIIHCNDLQPLPVAVMTKLFSFGTTKIVYDAHEYETEVKGLIGIRKSLAKFLERVLIKFVDKVITVNDSIADKYVEMYNIDKPCIVLNSPNKLDVIEKSDIFRKKFNLPKEHKIFLYQGGFSKGRGIEILLETFANIDIKNVCIVFMGYGELEKKVKEYADKYKNIFYHDAVTPQVLLDYTVSADYGIILYNNICLNNYYCLPNKFFEYSMTGLPIICSNFPVMNDFMKKYNAGVCAEPDNIDSITNAIKSVMQKDYNLLSKNARKMAVENCWEEQEKVLLNLYKDLV